MTRARRALGAAVLLMLLIPAIAEAAWSTQQQVIGKLSSASPVIGVDETGTMALGLGGLNPATYIERPPGLAAWNSSGVVVTEITGAPPSARFALSSSGAAVVTWSTGSAFSSTAFAAYKPAGKGWGAGTALDGPTGFDAPVPVIDEDGHAAVVWARKSAVHLLNMPDEIVYAAPSGGGWGAPAKIAAITVPTPHDEDPEGGFSYNGCPLELRAAMSPGGTPLVGWNDAYASYKLSGGANDGLETALCGVRTAAAGGGAPTDVTPRPALGWYAAPAANMPSWTQLSLSVSGTDSKTAIVVRGLEDSLLLSGCAEGNACANQERQTRVSLGSGAALGIGSPVGIQESAGVALRNGRILLLADGPSTALRAGVGPDTGLPSLTALPEDFQLFGASLALSDAGAGHIAAFGNNIGVQGLRLFDAPAAGAFAGPQIVDSSTGASRLPSLALDCKGLPVMAWSRSSSNQIFSSVFDAAPSVCGSGPEPEKPSGGGGGGGATGGAVTGGPTVIQTPAPVPSLLATLGTPKVGTDGSNVTFQIVCSPLTNNACGGKVVITKSNGGKKARLAKSATGVKIGSVSFSGLRPGGKKTLEVPLVKSAQRELAAGKRIEATIAATVRDGGGNVRVTTKHATLKKPR